MAASDMLDEALRCHDVWPLLEAWARAERELQRANEAFTTSVDVDKASTAPVSCSEPGLRVKAAAKRLDEATAALLAAVPEEVKP